jgi:hypothetical protein
MNLNANSVVSGGEFEKFKNDFILSGIFSNEWIKAYIFLYDYLINKIPSRILALFQNRLKTKGRFLLR